MAERGSRDFDVDGEKGGGEREKSKLARLLYELFSGRLTQNDSLKLIHHFNWDLNATLGSIFSVPTGDLRKFIDEEEDVNIIDISTQYSTMEVSGRGASTRPSAEHEMTSDGSHRNQCEQCQDKGITTDADGYCTECGYFLCGSCIKIHSRQRKKKNHTVMMGRDMPRQKTGTIKCSKHPGETIKVYCKSENIIGCVLCFAVEHKSCDTALICNLCKDFETSKEVKNILKASEQQKKKVDEYRKVIQEYHMFNNNCYDGCVEDFQKFRADIVEKLDRLGEVVVTEAGRHKDENKKKLDLLSDSVTTLENERELLTTEIELLQKSKKRELLFISVKKNQEKIEGRGEKLRVLNTEWHVPSFSFTEDVAVQNDLDEMISTRSVKLMTGDIRCTEKMNVKASKDRKNCCITGMVEVAPSVLALADFENKNIKIFDVNKNKITQRRQLITHPSDITVIPGSRVAVTVPLEQQIKLFSRQHLTFCGTVDVDGACQAIESTGDNLIVAFAYPEKIELMNIQGTVLKSVVHASIGASLLDLPSYMSLNRDHSAAYISDCCMNMVTKFDMEGTVLWTYKDEELIKPYGALTGKAGCIYVCSSGSNDMRVISSTGVRMRTVPLTHFQIECPLALCSSHDQSTRYLSSGSYDPEQCNYIRRLSLQ